jgi:hypothetical protein
LAARFGAAATGIGTSLHKFRPVRYAFTFVGASVANCSAHPAGLSVKIRAAQHKIRARQTDLSAVLEQNDVFRFGMFAAHLQTMINCFQTNGVTA